MFETSIQRPPLFIGRGHLFAVARLLYIAFLPLLSGQQIIFSSEMVTGKRQYEQEPCRYHVHR